MAKIDPAVLRDRIIITNFATTLRETADRLNKTPEPFIFDEVHYTRDMVVDHNNDETHAPRM